MGISQKKAGVILTYLGEAVKVLTTLLYTPLMLNLLGQSEYGLYQLVYSVVSYMGLLSLGFGGAYVRFYSKYKEKGDADGEARLNGMFMLIFSVIAGICVLCGAVMVFNIEAVFGSGLTESEYSTARILFVIMVINLALTFIKSVFASPITAHEHFFFQKLLTLLQNLFNPFLTLPLLLLGYGSVSIVLITTILTVATLFADIFYSFKKLHIKFKFKGLEFSLLKEMWIFTFFIFLNQIIDQVNWNVGKFLLGRLINTAAVAVYGIGAQVNSLCIQFSNAVSNVFVPKVNSLVEKNNDGSELTRLFTRVSRVQFIIMALILSGFVFFGKPFMRIWANELSNPEIAYYVALVLISSIFIPLIQNLGIEIQRAKNMHRTRSVVYFFMAIINIFASIPLIMNFGVIGATIGTACSLVLGNIIFMNWYYHKRIGLDMIYFWKQILKFIPSLVIPLIVGAAIMFFVPINSIFMMLVFIAVYTLVYCASMWLLGMNNYEKELILKPLKKIFKRG